MYIEKLNSILYKWLSGEVNDEWLFETFRASEIKTLSPTDAFLAITETVNILFEQNNEAAAAEILETILCLARTSGTTEIPHILVEKRLQLESFVSDKCDYTKQKLQEIFKYYRV